LNGIRASTFPLIETSWSTWLELYPNSEVVNFETGHNRNYQTYPYTRGNEDYRYDDFLIFPVSHENGKFSTKERVLGIIGANNVTVIPFPDSGSDLLKERINGEELLIYRNKEKNLMFAYQALTEGGMPVNLQLLPESELPNIMQDSDGNKWDIFGVVTQGQRKGERLQSVDNNIAYWFSWVAFYPNFDLVD
jgi:hypothetical protein